MKVHSSFIFICLVAFLAPSFGTASTNISTPKDPSPVYFPSLPDPLLKQDFGEKISLSLKSAKSRRSGDVSNDLPPVLSPKLTTTTEKLPLAQQSHVANSSITEAPVPAYLTDTVYYDSGPTPSPKQSRNGFSEIAPDSVEDREGEKYLQSILSYQSPSYGLDEIDPLLNPSILYYIPSDSAETVNRTLSFEKSTLQPQTSTSRIVSSTVQQRPDPTTEAIRQTSKTRPSPRYRPPKESTFQPETSTPRIFSSTTQQRLNPARKSIAKTSATRPPSRYQPPKEFTFQPETSTQRTVSSPAYQRRDRTTEAIRQTSTTRLPPRSRLRSTSYRSSTTQLKAGSRTLRPKARHRPSQKVRKQDSKRTDTPKYKIAPRPNNIHSEFFDSYEPKFSDQNLGSFDGSLSIVAPSATSQPSKRRRTKIKKHKILKSSLSKEPPPPQKEVAQVVEIYRLPGQEDSEEFFEQYERDYTIDFDNASGSAPQSRYKPSLVTTSNRERYTPPVRSRPHRERYRTPSVTISPYKQAPVYRTSTKSYRAPESLFKVDSIENTSGKKSPPRDFIEAVPNIYVPQEYNENDIPGVGGTDYPIYHRVPETKFRCSEQDHPGLYADPETDCQAFYICQTDGREHSFLCPNGTVFNQRFFVCDWWYNFACEQANDFYSLNAFLYEFREDGVKRGISYS